MSSRSGMSAYSTSTPTRELGCSSNGRSPFCASPMRITSGRRVITSIQTKKSFHGLMLTATRRTISRPKTTRKITSSHIDPSKSHATCPGLEMGHDRPAFASAAS